MAISNVGQVFVDLSSIGTWSTQLKELNQNAWDQIDAFEKSSDLSGVFEGDKMDGFSESVSSLMQQAKDKHINLEDFSGAFLTDVINMMENE